MSRTNIDIDEEACRTVMERYRLATKREAVLGMEMATCDPVRMELLAGARDESHLNDLRRLLARAVLVSTVPTTTGLRASTGPAGEAGRASGG